ncbi:MupA/Atu3671 family FMN-dependent luciferase-like monooxygenase [Aquimarina discodermiae]
MDFSLFYFSNQDTVGEDKYKYLLDSVKFADKNDFTAIWLPERHFHEFGGIFPNPSVLAASLTTITEKIGIRSGSVVLPLHDTIRVAEEWSVVDNLSKGRVSLSIASGWHADDFVFSPENFEGRHSIMFEKLEELKALWRGEKIKRVNGLGNEVDLNIFPKPIQKEIPIWITSGGNEETFRSAGKLGANILTHMLGQDIDTLQKNIKVYKDTLRSNGYSVDDAKVTIMLHTYIGSNLEEVKKTVEIPFKNYIESNINLFNKVLGIDIEEIRKQGINKKDLLDVIFERYWNTSALLGTKESCSSLVKKLYNTGITEIGCLIDFGISGDKFINGLSYLNDLRKEFSSPKIGVKDQEITSIQITPSYLNTLVDDESSQEFINSLKHIIVGGESFSHDLKQKLSEKTKATVYNMYGPTEATIWSVMEKVDFKEYNTIGKPIDNTKIYVLDEDLKVLPTGVIGELYIGGAQVARGYLNRKELTKEKFLDSPFIKGDRLYKTGDFVRWLADGTIEFIGRKDAQVKVRGYRIELGEIEVGLDAIEEVKQSAVLVREDESGAKQLVAYVIKNTDISIEEILSRLQEKFPDYMIPRIYVFLEEFPLTPNGKLDRKSLPAPDDSSYNRKKYVAPSTETERELVKIWENLLGVEDIGVNDNFFELGGHSLLAMRLTTLVSEKFEVEINVKEVFEFPVLKRYVQYLELMIKKLKNNNTVYKTYDL